MQLFFGIIIGLIILMLLVVAHEFGHFIMARKSGVKVNEFGIGFPPRLIAWVKSPKTQKWERLPKSAWNQPQDGLIFSLNLLPIGGFCAMDGESAADTRPGTFGATSFWNKTKILFGGVAMNWLVAFVIFTILALTGMPQFLPNQFNISSDAKQIGAGVRIEEIISGSPAELAGFHPGDQILAVDGQSVTYPSDVTEIGNQHRGEELSYVVLRDNTETELRPTLNPTGAEYSLGVSMSFGQTFVRSTWSAPIVALGTTVQLTGETFRGLGEMIWNFFSGVFRQFSFNSDVREEGQSAIQAAGDSISGPVGIIGVIFPTFASSGASNLAFLAALISVSLACMNILPIPALDGGRWCLIALYKLRHKKLTKETEERIVSRAFMILILLIVLISILDITRFF